MPDTDPLVSVEPRDAEAPRDPEAEAVRARVMMRLLGEDEGPAKIGRFTLLERVAEGGMGVVFAAYDPELDRKVAVKLLRRDLADASVRKRIVREAQAMAKLSHPNVAQVYEVGEHQGGTFIAMEFVRGETLREWQKHAGRPWRDVLEVYVQAGRGLAAAHAAGLVHRDFKPDNAIVGRDRRVRVLDFGLARAGEVVTTAEIETQTVLPAPHDDALATPLTHTGSIMGTPAYMAPEQFLGEEVTAKTDQFALCVSLWEGLYGERPFAGNTRADVIANVTRGRLREAAKQSRVPTWLRAVLVRGLAVGPADRFATTDALLAALQNDPSRRRRRIMLAGASVLTVALVVAGVEGFRRYDRAQKIAACGSAGASIDEVWNAEARTRVRDGLLATGVSYAPTTAENVMPWLDDQAEAWRKHRTEACMNTDVRQSWDADTLDRAVWCLDERRLELASLVAALEHADARVSENAVKSAAALTRVSPCLDATVLANLPPPPNEDARAAIAEVRVELARGRTVFFSGKYAEGLDVVRPARARAEALGWPPLSAASHLLMGKLLERSGSYAESEVASVAAYVEAAKANAWDVAATAATDLVYTVGIAQARHAEGRTWASHAEVAAMHAGDPHELREATRALALGSLHGVAGAYVEAKPLLERALAIRENVLGPHHPDVGANLHNLANVHDLTGSHDAAKALSERALRIWENVYGPDHPNVSASLIHLAQAHSRMGEYAEAKALCERALAIEEKAFGPDHPGVAAGLSNLARAHSDLGEYGEAKAMQERALAIQEKALGPDHPNIATGLATLAIIHSDTGGYDEAKALLGRALAIKEKALGPDHPEVATTILALADVHHDAGAYDEATPLYEQALTIYETALGDHADLGYPLVGLAYIAFAQARFEDAVPLAERGVSAFEIGSAPAAEIADARFLLARALWQAPVRSGRDRARAARLAALARDAYRGANGLEEELAEVEAWLATHSLSR